MKLSGPIFQLKRRAKLQARNTNVSLTQALDQVAREEGFARWSILSARMAGVCQHGSFLDKLQNGDLVLIAARPGQGKTRLGLRLLLEALRDGRRAAFFTLELTEHFTRNYVRSLDEGRSDANARLEVVTNEDICGDYIIRYFSDVEPGTIAVIDYLQILDQHRAKPVLGEQIVALADFARDRGVILVCLSQVDRSFDPEEKDLPDIGDIRLPNKVDIKLFTKACFLHRGEVHLS